MKSVLITGGSSGVGFEISKHFARENYQILWVSLIQEELEDFKKELETLAKFRRRYPLQRILSQSIVLYFLNKELSDD